MADADVDLALHDARFQQFQEWLSVQTGQPVAFPPKVKDHDMAARITALFAAKGVRVADQAVQLIVEATHRRQRDTLKQLRVIRDHRRPGPLQKADLLFYLANSRYAKSDLLYQALLS